MKLDHDYIRKIYCDPAADLSRATHDIIALCDEIAAQKQINAENLKKVSHLSGDLAEAEEELTRCQRRLDAANSYAEGCAKQAGDLAEGVLDALGIKWSTVCPDDATIIQHVRDLRAKYEQLEIQFEYLEGPGE